MIIQIRQNPPVSDKMVQPEIVWKWLKIESH